MKISFVIPAHNAAAWLPAAVDSVLAQTHQDVEVVIVNDGSTDSTHQYLAWLHSKLDKRVKIVTTSREGRSVARNLGNDLATGEVIAVLDADDLAYPKRAEITAREFARGAEFLYGSAAVIDAVGQKRGELVAAAFDREKAAATLLNGIVHSTVAYSKEFSRRFPYRSELAELGLDDWGQQVEAAAAGVKLHHVPNALAVYRELETGISRTRDEVKVAETKKQFLEGLKVVDAKS